MDSGAPQGGSEVTPPRTSAPPATASSGGRFRWLHAAADRVPTRWFGGMAVAVFLATTAAFGGLATVAAEPIPSISGGDEHVGDPFAITVERAVLIDDLPEAGVEAALWERVVVVVVTAENRWTEALPSGDSGLAQALRIPDLGNRPPDAVARFDDTTKSPWLQPGVPAELAVAWVVPGGLFRAGDDLALVLRDSELHTGTFVTAGRSWGDPVVAARVSVPVTDVGAGATAEREQ